MERYKQLFHEGRNNQWGIIDFSYFSGTETFDSRSKEYRVLDSLYGDKWQQYINDMASTGVTVEYRSVKDIYRIIGN